MKIFKARVFFQTKIEKLYDPNLILLHKQENWGKSLHIHAHNYRKQLLMVTF